MLLNKRISLLYFINLIKFDVLIIILYSIVVLIVRHYKNIHFVSIPLSIAALIGTLISLLLAFRTSQSYERWWEARIVWGSIVNESRTFIRQVKQFIPADATAQQYVARFTSRQIIWVYALGESLRKMPFSQPVLQYLTENQLSGRNIPNMLLEQHAEELKKVSELYNVNPNKQIQIDSTLSRLTDAMGKCERIKNTVFPKSYSVLIHFIIYVFLTIFPFGLSEVGDIPETILSVFLPLLFIMIEKTAIIMQDPFENRPTDTPVTAIAQTIEGNLREMIGLQPVTPPPADNDKYYVL